MAQHESQDELAGHIKDAATHVAVGGMYRHYKGESYTVISLALLEATNEPCVIYRAEYGEHISFIRPLSDWLATVEVDGRTTARFTPA